MDNSDSDFPRPNAQEVVADVAPLFVFLRAHGFAGPSVRQRDTGVSVWYERGSVAVEVVSDNLEPDCHVYLVRLPAGRARGYRNDAQVYRLILSDALVLRRAPRTSERRTLAQTRRGRRSLEPLDFAKWIAFLRPEIETYLADALAGSTSIFDEATEADRATSTAFEPHR